MTKTINDYVTEYFEQTGYTESDPGLFFPSLGFGSLSATVFSSAMQEKYRAVMRYMYADVVLNFDVFGLTFSDLHTRISNKLFAAASMKIGKWELQLKAIAAAAGLTSGELLEDYYKTITKAGSEKDQNGGMVTITGTQRRNSFNSNEMTDTSGATTSTTDTTSRTHSFTDRVDTERGNIRPKAESIRAFFESAEVMNFVSDVVNFFMIQIGSMVY